MGIVNAVRAFLLPQAFQWRNDIGEIAVDAVAAFIAHFNRKCNGIQDADGSFVFPFRFVWVTFAADSNKIHFRDSDNAWFFGREVKFFVFFLIIKRHGVPFLCTVIFFHILFVFSGFS